MVCSASLIGADSYSVENNLISKASQNLVVIDKHGFIDTIHIIDVNDIMN